MWQSARMTVLSVLVWMLPALAVLAGPPATIEQTRLLDRGTVILYHRTPALEEDLQMPLWAPGTVRDSWVYRLQDRKHRDIVRYVYARIDAVQPIEEIQAFYLKALGLEAQVEKNAETGEVVIFWGNHDHCRVVTLTPLVNGCRLLLEHVEHFTIPPRVYTEEEQRVIRLLDEMAATYRTALHVSYVVEQRIIEEHADPQAPPRPALTWTVDFVRPRQLFVTAKIGDALGLSLVTRGDALVVSRPGNEDEARPFGDTLTSLLVPEMESDIAARMMLEDALVSDAVDFLALSGVPGMPATRQTRAILTFPEDGITLILTIDIQHKLLLESVTEVRDGDTLLGRIIRTYSRTVREYDQPPSSAAPAVHPADE